MSDPFDWNPFKGGSGEFVKFESVGDSVVGHIVAIRTHTFDKDKGAVALIDLDTGAEETVTLACDKVDLRTKLAEIAPQVGDKLGVKYVGNERTPNGTMKMFAIQHKQGEPPPPADDFGGYSEDPF